MVLLGTAGSRWYHKGLGWWWRGLVIRCAYRLGVIDKGFDTDVFT